MPVKVFISGFLVCLTLLSHAQNVRNLYKKADDAFYKDDPEVALPLFKEVLSIDPNYLDARYKAEICELLENRNRPLNAIINYRDNIGQEDKFYYYFLGRILDYRYQFNEALAAYNQFLKVEAYKSPEIQKETRGYISRIRSLLEFIQTENIYRASKMPTSINQVGTSEFSPIFIPQYNELIYISMDESTDERVATFYQSQKSQSSWGTPSSIMELEFGEETANAEVTGNGNELILYKDREFLISKREDDSWTSPEVLDYRLALYPKDFMYINESKDRLIFSAYKGSRKNGLDLYQTYLDASEKWEKPVLLSDNLNSALNEGSAFLSNDGNTLYFSSAGHNSIGGYDIFKSEFDSESQTWTNPVNLGYPINTPDDEIDFYISPDEEFGFVSSNRFNDADDFDIYRFYKPNWFQVDGRVFNAENQSKVGNGRIEFITYSAIKEKFTGIIDSLGNYEMELPENGTYTVNIWVDDQLVVEEITDLMLPSNGDKLTQDFIVEAGKIVSTEDRIAIEEIEEDDPKRYTEYEKSTAELSTLGSKYRVAQKAILENIYFDFATSKLRRESNAVLDELYFVLNYYPNLEIEIAGHTDNVGPSDANLWLSENRAKAVKNVLVDLGISESRISTKGYGETQPIATNKREKGGRELNRRIEVLVKDL